MYVHGAVDAIVVLLHGDPVLEGTHVVAQMEQPSRPHAGEYHTFMTSIGWLSHDPESRTDSANFTPVGTKKV